MAYGRAMVFIDGTNLFHRLEAARVRIDQLSHFVLREVLGRTPAFRIYLYSSQPHLDKAVLRHGPRFLQGIRIVKGDAVPTGDGNYREKGVDALLVADLIYHAAAK